MVGAKTRASLTSELRQPDGKFPTPPVAPQTYPSGARMASEGFRPRS
jgi:hypothetical protein